MRKLTKEEIKNPPAKVAYVYACVAMDMPIGLTLYNEILDEYPEYFPDEVEHRRKWDAIPQEVHDSYSNEYREMLRDNFKINETPATCKEINTPSVISEVIDNVSNLKKETIVVHKKRKEEFIKLHKKHYGKYGIKPVK